MRIRSVLVGLPLFLAVVLGAGRLQVYGRALLDHVFAPEASWTPFTYQGQLDNADGPVTGDCRMAFRLYDTANSDGQVGTPMTQTVAVDAGLFAVTLDFGKNAFTGGSRWLGIRVQCPGDAGFTDLGRQALTPAPYAHYAYHAPWSGLGDIPADIADGDDDTTYTAGAGLTLAGTEFSVSGSPYAGVVVVAKSGGDFTTVQAAIDSVTDAGESNPYLVWVAPGVYEESVTMKPYVSLQGAGQELTIITSTVGFGNFPVAGTVTLTRNVTLRDLTVYNAGTSYYQAALVGRDGTMGVSVSNVTAGAWVGAGGSVYGVILAGDEISATLEQVTAWGEGSGTTSIGLITSAGGTVSLRGGAFTGRGGSNSYGIYASWYQRDGALVAEGLTARAEGADSHNTAFYLRGDDCVVTGSVASGDFTARGADAMGVRLYGSQVSLTAREVMVLAVGSTSAKGLYIQNGAQAALYRSSFVAQGTSLSRGIENATGGTYPTVLYAEDVEALAEGASDTNYGLRNYVSSESDVTLRGGSYRGVSGTTAAGIYNLATSNSDGTRIDAQDITSTGEDGVTNYGIYSSALVTMTLRGGTYRGVGGASAYGLYNATTAYQPPVVTAEHLTIRGENATAGNYGIYSLSDATIEVRDAVANGATNAVYVADGDVVVSNTRLVGGPVSGKVTCVLVSRGAGGAGNVSVDGSTCP